MRARTVVTAASVEDAFCALYPDGVRRFTLVAPLVDAALSPGDLRLAPEDEELGPLPPSVLRGHGWPVEDEPEDEDSATHRLPVLPWLGHVPLAEAGELLTIDGFARAPELLLQPAAGLAFAGAAWHAEIRLEPDAWLAMSLRLTRPPLTSERRGFGALYLGLRRLDQTVAVVVLPHAAGRDALARVLQLDDTAFHAALDDEIDGRLRV